jgi:hypothetical protein
MSAPPQAIAPNPHTNLVNVYVQIANKIGVQSNKKTKNKNGLFRATANGCQTDYALERLPRKQGPKAMTELIRTHGKPLNCSK